MADKQTDPSDDRWTTQDALRIPLYTDVWDRLGEGPAQAKGSGRLAEELGTEPGAVVDAITAMQAHGILVIRDENGYYRCPSYAAFCKYRKEHLFPRILASLAALRKSGQTLRAMDAAAKARWPTEASYPSKWWEGVKDGTATD